MSKTTKSNDTRQWFLRISNGTVFGPVATQGLVVWAEQGRVAPGNEISEDREAWIPAESLDDLCMCWLVQRADGAVQGPFNRQALDGLIKEGKIPPDANLVNRNNPEEVLTVEEAGGPAPHDVPAVTGGDASGGTPGNRMLELEVKLERSQEALRKAEEELKRVHLQESVRRRRAPAAAGRPSQRSAAPTPTPDTGALSKQLETAEKALTRERNQFKKQMAELQDQLEQAQSGAPEETAPAPDNTEELNQRDRQIQDLQSQVEQAREEFKDSCSEMARETDEQRTRSEALQEELKQLTEQRKDELDTLRRELEGSGDTAALAETLRAEAQELRAQLELAGDATEQAALAQTEVEELRASLEQARDATDQAARARTDAEDALNALQTEREAEQADLRELQSSRAEADAEHTARVDELEALNAELADAARATAAVDVQGAHDQLVDDLRAQLRAQQADLDIMRTELDAARQPVATAVAAPLQPHVDALEQECQSLREQLDEARTEAQQKPAPLSLDTPSRDDAFGSDLEARLETLTEEHDHTATQLAEQRKECGQVDQHLHEARRQLEEERAAHAETLQFSNDRDVQLQEEIETLRRRLNDAESRRITTGPGDVKALEDELQALRTALREMESRPATAPSPASAGDTGQTERVFQEIVLEEISSVENSLADEREGFKSLRDSSLKRQEACQTRIQNLQRLLSGDVGRHRRRLKERDAAVVELGELKKALEEARKENQRVLEQAESREEDLRRRLRRAETQGAQQSERLVTAENLSDGARDLAGQLQTRTQGMAQVEQQLENERREWRQTEKALLRRIEELEQGAGSLLLETEAPADEQAQPIRLPERPPKTKKPQRDGFQRPPWMTLR